MIEYGTVKVESVQVAPQSSYEMMKFPASMVPAGAFGSIVKLASPEKFVGSKTHVSDCPGVRKSNAKSDESNVPY